MRFHKSLPALCLLVATSAAVAGPPILEVEPNNTMATANFISSANYPSGAFAFDGHIGVGDVDWISFTLTQQTVIDAATFGQPNSLIGDSQIILIAGNQTSIIAWDDDSGINLFSAMQATVPAGTYFIGITAFDDLGLGAAGTNPPVIPTGNHPQAAPFDYKLTVGFNPVPAPGSLALLGIGGFVALRRKR